MLPSEAGSQTTVRNLIVDFFSPRCDSMFYMKIECALCLYVVYVWVCVRACKYVHLCVQTYIYKLHIGLVTGISLGESWPSVEGSNS